ncbi:MAG: hypothetical protein H7Z41_08830, partial [Cytophagales bacterium]|nr:hypothetical protein [Armatimonadota bacterium]
MSHPSRCLRFSASLPAIAAMVTTALPPVAAAAAASLLFVSGNHARAADPWSEWQPLPDHRQTAVDLHYRSVTIKGKPSLVYQLRNRYGRAVTVRLQITGAAEDGLEIEEQTIALKANGKSGKPDESREIVSSSLRTVTRVAVLALEFREEDGPPPDAGIAGAGSRSAETQRLTTEIARARRAAERADRDANEADRAYATMRFSVDAFRNGIYNPQTGLRYRIGPNDVMQAQSRAEAARNKMRQAHDQLDGLKKRLA